MVFSVNLTGDVSHQRIYPSSAQIFPGSRRENSYQSGVWWGFFFFALLFFLSDLHLIRPVYIRQGTPGLVLAMLAGAPLVEGREAREAGTKSSMDKNGLCGSTLSTNVVACIVFAFVSRQREMHRNVIEDNRCLSFFPSMYLVYCLCTNLGSILRSRNGDSTFNVGHLRLP